MITPIRLFYCARNLHDPDKPTEYYQGGGSWKQLDLTDPNSRLGLRLYPRESMAKAIADSEPGVDWFSIDIVA